VHDAVLVDDRVGGDRAGDRHRKERATPLPHAAHEQDPRRDDQHSCRLPRRRRGAREHDRAGQHEHRREPARERIDDRQLGARIRERQQREIPELERRRRGEIRPDTGVETPADRRHGRPHDGADEQDDRRERLRVASPGEQQVPDRMDHGRRERECKCLGRQGYLRIAASSTVR